jgi:hypothetical protein
MNMSGLQYNFLISLAAWFWQSESTEYLFSYYIISSTVAVVQCITW